MPRSSSLRRRDRYRSLLRRLCALGFSLAIVFAVSLALGACRNAGVFAVQTYSPYSPPTEPFSPDDPDFLDQWHYRLINVPEAWSILRDSSLPQPVSAGNSGGESVVVAVIDTGIREHEDLPAEHFVDGYDFVDGDPDPTEPLIFPDGRWPGFHGTHVTGTIVAATNNDAGVAGIGTTGTAGPGVKVMPLRSLSYDGVGTTSADLAEPVLHAVGIGTGGADLVETPARVLNLSLGGPAVLDAILYEAIEEAVAEGATVIAAGGNSDGPVFAPAVYDNTIAVAAVTASGERAGYSNFGSDIDFAAPGGTVDLAVLSTMDYPCEDPWERYGGTPPDCDSGDTTFDDYVGLAGTSMATPHVSAVVALLYSLAPDLDQAAVYRILVESSRDAGDGGPDDYYGHGVIDAAAALAYVVQAYEDYPVRPVAGSGSGSDDPEASDGGGAGWAEGAERHVGLSGPRGRSLGGVRGALVPAGGLNAGLDYDGGRVLFALETGSISPRELSTLRQRLATEIPEIAEIRGEDPSRLHALLENAARPADAIESLAAEPQVKFAQPNYFYTRP